MEEKERYVIDYCDDLIFDTEKEYYPSGDTICKTLNQQYKENKQLEQQLHDLPNKIVEEIRIELYSKAMSITGTGVNCVRLYDIQKILNTNLKKYGGEDE